MRRKTYNRKDRLFDKEMVIMISIALVFFIIIVVVSESRML